MKHLIFMQYIIILLICVLVGMILESLFRKVHAEEQLFVIEDTSSWDSAIYGRYDITSGYLIKELDSRINSAIYSHKNFGFERFIIIGLTEDNGAIGQFFLRGQWYHIKLRSNQYKSAYDGSKIQCYDKCLATTGVPYSYITISGTKRTLPSIIIK